MVKGKIIDFSRVWADMFWKASWSRIDGLQDIPVANEVRMEFFMRTAESITLAFNTATSTKIVG